MHSNSPKPPPAKPLEPESMTTPVIRHSRDYLAPHKLAQIIYIHNLESLLLFLHRRRGVPFINMHAFSGSFPLLLGYTTMFCVVLCCAMACLILLYNGGSGGASVEAGADAGAVEGEDVTIENAHNLKISKHSVRHNGINGIILNIHSPHLLPYTCVCGGSFFLRPLLSLPHNSPIWQRFRCLLLARQGAKTNIWSTQIVIFHEFANVRTTNIQKCSKAILPIQKGISIGLIRSWWLL